MTLRLGDAHRVTSFFDIVRAHNRGAFLLQEEILPGRQSDCGSLLWSQLKSPWCSSPRFRRISEAEQLFFVHAGARGFEASFHFSQGGAEHDRAF